MVPSHRLLVMPVMLVPASSPVAGPSIVRKGLTLPAALPAKTLMWLCAPSVTAA